MQSIVYCLVVVCGILGCSDLMYAQTPTATPQIAPTVTTTLTPSSDVITDNATDITSGSATLNGRIYKYAIIGRKWYEYGTASGSLNYTAEVQSLDELDLYYKVSTNISELSPATTYYYRLAGQDKMKTNYGSEKSFTTLEATATPQATPSPQAPIVTTGEATTNDELYSLTLNGTVDANGLLTTTWFEYGANSGSYTNTSSTQTVDGTNDTAVGIKISASEGTPYYYRIVAQNSAGTSYGNEMYIIVPVDTWWWEATKSMEVSPATLILKKRQSKDVIVTLTWGYGSLVGGETVETEIATGKRRISILPKSVVTDENGEAKFTITARRSGKAKITFRAKRGQYSGTLETTCIVRIRR